MSSAILYLAIVVIWAFLLVPRWLRRSHAVPAEAVARADNDNDLATATEGAGNDADAAEFAVDASSRWSAAGPLWPGHQSSADPYEPQSYEPQSYEPQSYEPQSYEPTAPPEARAPRVDLASTARGRPHIGRAGILQARRRMLTTLMTLAIVSAVCRVGGLTPWWTCVPPAGMLGIYLLLLREAALADAESQHRRREALRLRAARQRAREEWAAR